MKFVVMENDNQWSINEKRYQ